MSMEVVSFCPINAGLFSFQPMKLTGLHKHMTIHVTTAWNCPTRFSSAVFRQYLLFTWPPRKASFLASLQHHQQPATPLLCSSSHQCVGRMSTALRAPTSAPATVRRVLPYKDFLQPALHRRFSSTALVLLATAYVQSLWLSSWSSCESVPDVPARVQLQSVFERMH